jgi:hypothetical protein
MLRFRLVAFALLVALLSASALLRVDAQQRRPDPAALLAAEREALARFSYMDGAWRGTGWTVLPSGEKHTSTQTERIGPFLDGSVKVIEGRGYDGDGKVTFNALGILSYKPDARACSLRSYAMGNAGDFVLTPTEDGYVWEMPAGPSTIRYTTVVKDGTWKEVGDRLKPGNEPVQFFEMTLGRVGDTDWPVGGAVPPR